MRITVDLHRPVSRSAIIIVVICGLAAYLSLSTAQFMISVITDPKVNADTSIIEGTAKYFPNSAQAQARMASRLIESRIDVALSHELTVERSVYFATRAVKLAPNNYEYRMLLAAANELRGDLAESEKELRAALNLAPHLALVNWRLANLLLREGKLDQAIPEFRVASEADPELLMPTLGLLWQASDGKRETLKAAVSNDSRSQATLAQFLSLQGQYDAAVEVAHRIDRESLLGLAEGGKLIESLISAGRIDLASELWRDLFGVGDKQLIWNESFERTARDNFTQFDWSLSESKYARIGITNAKARIGQRSLKISYQGIDTTSLKREIYQLVAVRPGARYALQCYVRAEKLVTPGGPQVVLTTPDFNTVIAASAAVEAGSYDDWRLLTLDFVAPADARSLLITIGQTPQFSYVDPTQGTVWFDDFSLMEQQ
jgi:tetratricopeptide (TPR) repeat protein